jgi:hypothetical protein
MIYNEWMNASTHPYAGYRYPAEIINHAVWLYFRLALSFRDNEEILAARGIVITYESVTGSGVSNLVIKGESRSLSTVSGSSVCPVARG